MRTPRRRPALLTLVPLAAAALLASTVTLAPADAAEPDLPPTPAITASEATPEISVDPPPVVPPAAVARADNGAGATSPDATTAQAAAALGLHSRPGSNRTILLDFDGATVSGSQWSAGSGLANPYAAEAWSLDADPSFSTAELARIEKAWAAVAEDYAPFDVDVTTEDPGNAALDRTSSADQVFGMRAVITDSDTWQSVCGGTACGGVAYIDVFDLAGANHLRYQPAWVFPENFSDDAKIMGDVISHEVGHTLGLVHDGTTSPSSDYYRGQGAWGPIMGSPSTVPLSQWSRGEYAAASSSQDDLEVIAQSGAPRVADVAGDTLAGAATGLPSGTTGLISTPSDVDLYRLRSCTGPITVAGTPAAVAPDLDLQLQLLNASGAVVDSDDPAVARSSSSVATGLDASVDTTASGGDYYVRVDGVGSGSPSATGYSDYGSLGRYGLRLSGSCGTTAGAPSAPQNVTASVSGTSVTVAWSPPASSGTSAVSGYRVTTDPDNAVVVTSAGTTRATFNALTRGTSYFFTVVATNATGNGSPTVVRATTSPDRPSSPASLSADATGNGDIEVGWTPPVDDGGSPVTGYRFRVGSIDQVVDAGIGHVSVAGLPSGPATVTVNAVNAAGEGVGASRTATVVGGSGPASNRNGSSGSSLTARVRPSLQGRAVTGGKLKARPGTWSRPVAVAYTWRVGSRVLARSASYRPRSTQVGKRLVLTVTATARGDAPVSFVLRTAKVRR